MIQAQAGATAFPEDMEALKHNFFVRGYFKSRGYQDSNELAKDKTTATRYADKGVSLLGEAAV